MGAGRRGVCREGTREAGRDEGLDWRQVSRLVVREERTRCRRLEGVGE